MTEDLEQLKRDYEAISTSGSKPEVRDLYKYIISQKELTEKDIAPREFLLGDWLPLDSFGMVYANRGVGKSWFCMALCVAVARGDKFFLGWEINNRHSALYVDGEMAQIDIKQRFDALVGLPLSNLFILPSEELYREGSPLCLDEVEEQKAIEQALTDLEAKNSRPQLIVLDNLSTLRRGINENDNNEAQKLLDWLVSLRHKGYSVIIVHHTGKSGQQRGASIIEVPMDFTLRLSEPTDKASLKDGASFDFELEKVRVRYPKTYKGNASLRPDIDGVLYLATDPNAIHDRIYQILRYTGLHGKKSVRELMEVFKVSLGTISSDRTKLISEGYLDKKFRLTHEGEFFLHQVWPKEFKEPEEDQDLPF
jgi:hypothetical protein